MSPPLFSECFGNHRHTEDLRWGSTLLPLGSPVPPHGNLPRPPHTVGARPSFSRCHTTSLQGTQCHTFTTHCVISWEASPQACSSGDRLSPAWSGAPSSTLPSAGLALQQTSWLRGHAAASRLAGASGCAGCMGKCGFTQNKTLQNYYLLIYGLEASLRLCTTHTPYLQVSQWK